MQRAKEAEKQKKEIDNLTKDQRTVFVSQLTMKVTEKHLRDFFGQIGKVNDIIMIRDKYTGRHKGFAYVEMAELEKIPTCLMINGVVPDVSKLYTMLSVPVYMSVSCGCNGYSVDPGPFSLYSSTLTPSPPCSLPVLLLHSDVPLSFFTVSEVSYSSESF